MISIKTDITGVENGDTICSVWNSTDKKWVRILKDKDGNNINIYKLEVERSLNNGRNWILCLYKLNSKDKNQKHIFHLDLDVNFIFRVWQKSAFEMQGKMTKCLKEADFVFKECVKQTSGVNAGDASSSQSYPTSNSSSMAAQDCRVTETTSVVENKFENGCIVTMDTFKNKTDLENLWKNIKIDGKYNCAYIKIDGGFSGCINDYLNS